MRQKGSQRATTGLGSPHTHGSIVTLAQLVAVLIRHLRILTNDCNTLDTLSCKRKASSGNARRVAGRCATAVLEQDSRGRGNFASKCSVGIGPHVDIEVPWAGAVAPLGIEVDCRVVLRRELVTEKEV